LPEGPVVGRIEIRLAEDERARHRSSTGLEGRVDPAPDLGTKSVDHGQEAGASLDPAYVFGASAGENPAARRPGSRIIETLVSKKLHRREIGDDLDAIAAGEVVGTAVDAGSKAARKQAPVTFDARQIRVPRRQEKIAGGRASERRRSGMQEHGRRHDLGECRAAHGTAERVAYAPALAVEALHGSTDAKCPDPDEHDRGGTEPQPYPWPQQEKRSHDRRSRRSGAHGQEAPRKKREPEENGDVDHASHSGRLCSSRASQKPRDFR